MAPQRRPVPGAASDRPPATFRARCNSHCWCWWVYCCWCWCSCGWQPNPRIGPGCGASGRVSRQPSQDPKRRDRDPPALPQHSGSPSVTDRLASPAPTEPTAENRQAEPSGPPLPPGVDGEGLSSIRDDTFFRAAEHEAWFHLFAWLQTTSEQQLETVVQANVSSLQLLRQMPAYRGRLVRVQGVVRRAGPIAAPDNEAGIRSYWQCWLQDAAGTAPIVVYALQMPAGFPRGQALRETAEFTGVAYKRWAYQAESGLLVAPVLLAKTARWTPHPPPPARRPVTPTQLLLGTVCAALLAWPRRPLRLPEFSPPKPRIPRA